MNIHHSQNYLHSPELVQKLLQQSNIQTGDTVVEIGPGKGIITQALATAVGEKGSVIAVEYDQDLSDKLQAKFAHFPQVKIIWQDILQFPLENLPHNYKIFANIPFNITSKIFDKFFQPTHGPASAFLIVQHEAILEGKNRPTLKSFFILPLYNIEKIHDFSRKDFAPQPSVETSLYSFVRREQPLIPEQNYQLFQDFLAFISPDRVGEGTWQRLVRKQQRKVFAQQTGLQMGKGIKSQTIESLILAFNFVPIIQPHFKNIISGEYQKLKIQQAKTAKQNNLGQHHASQARRKFFRKK